MGLTMLLVFTRFLSACGAINKRVVPERQGGETVTITHTLVPWR